MKGDKRMSALTCSCGCTEDHVIARARTFDGVAIELWSSGDITGRLGQYPAGLSKARAQGAALRAARLAWGEISLYVWSELGDLVKTARRALVQTSLPAESFLRRSMAGETFRQSKRGVVKSTKREHHRSCQCGACGGRNLPAGWIPGPVKFAR
jgi:hypothetical protein